MSVHKPQDILLTDLGRASRMYAKIESVLAEASPTGMSLTTRDAYEFLIDMKPILEESGFSVIAPAWWGDPSAQIGARLFIDTTELEDVRRPGSGSDGEGQSLLGLESLVHYEWKIAVGDQPLSMEEFQALAHDLGMACLVETRDAAEIERALEADAEIIGINNRDLTTFEVDLTRTLEIKEMVPGGKVLVSESGIHTRDDVRRLEKGGIDAILVGEALVTSDDISGTIRELLGRDES